ncbi:MAG: hypothetical protein ACYTEZ_20485 [Planctomycetota bacterium]|jgi:hypothetical protein
MATVWTRRLLGLLLLAYAGLKVEAWIAAGEVSWSQDWIAVGTGAVEVVVGVSCLVGSAAWVRRMLPPLLVVSGTLIALFTIESMSDAAVPVCGCLGRVGTRPGVRLVAAAVVFLLALASYPPAAAPAPHGRRSAPPTA